MPFLARSRACQMIDHSRLFIVTVPVIVIACVCMNTRAKIIGIRHQAPDSVVVRTQSSSERLSLDDDDILNRSVASASLNTSNLLNNIHTLHDLAEDSVLAVKVRRGSKADEELTAVGTRAAVGHGQNTRTSVLQRAIKFVCELAAPDRLSTTTGTGRVTTLKHEAWDDAVEDDAVVLTCVGEASEVLACLNGVGKCT